MSNTEQTKKDIYLWTSEQARDARAEVISLMAHEAGIWEAVAQIPRLHFKNMDYDKYMINILALAKIIQMKNIGVRIK